MSKAFTSESDADDAAIAPPPLPPGLKNYMTPAGWARLDGEIKQLQNEKSRLSPSDVAARARIEKIDRRLRYLVPRHDAAQVLDPSRQPTDRVTFGARVTLRDAQGAEEAWRIVGIDEMDLERGDISWTAPLAAALLDRMVNDQVAFMNRRLTILKIDYPA